MVTSFKPKVSVCNLPQKMKKTKFRAENSLFPIRQTTRNLVLPAEAVTIQSNDGVIYLLFIVTNCSHFDKPVSIGNQKILLKFCKFIPRQVLSRAAALRNKKRRRLFSSRRDLLQSPFFSITRDVDRQVKHLVFARAEPFSRSTQCTRASRSRTRGDICTIPRRAGRRRRPRSAGRSRCGGRKFEVRDESVIIERVAVRLKTVGAAHDAEYFLHQIGGRRTRRGSCRPPVR